MEIVSSILELSKIPFSLPLKNNNAKIIASFHSIKNRDQKFQKKNPNRDIFKLFFAQYLYRAVFLVGVVLLKTHKYILKLIPILLRFLVENAKNKTVEKRTRPKA